MKTSINKKQAIEENSVKIITPEILRSWEPCTEGYKGFCELLPHGANLKDASDALTNFGRPEWANWLWEKCAKLDDFRAQTVISAADNGTATAGDAGTATAGDAGTATAGYAGTATAGYAGTATAGDAGTATAGDAGTATAGYAGTATAGTRGTATAGTRGTATAGDAGTATAGYAGTATAGDAGTATAGTRGTATAGTRGTATAGTRGTATAGEGGVLSLEFYDGSKYRRKIAQVGENGILANTAYVINDKFEFEVKK